MDSAAQAIMADLKNKKFAPVYFLQGEETYYIDWIAQFIEDNALPPADRSFNQTVLYGRDVSMNDLLATARRFPMMAERQVVIVREAQDMADLHKEAGGKQLLSYLTAPVPTTVLVFCYKHKTLDKRRELGDKIARLTTGGRFRKPYDNQLPEFISNYVAQQGFRIEEQAAHTLAEYVGNDLTRLVNEIDKVLISSQPGAAITVQEVIARVGISREYNIFELQKAIISRNSFTAHKIAHYFAANSKKNPAIPQVALLYSFFSKCLQAVGLPDKSEKALVSHLKISPYASRDYGAALRNYSALKIMNIIGELKRADLKLKGVDAGNQTEGQIVRELVAQILR